MLLVYALYDSVSDRLNEISAFSERGKCDRPVKKKIVTITQHKTTRKNACLQKISVDVERDS